MLLSYNIHSCSQVLLLSIFILSKIQNGVSSPLLREQQLSSSHFHDANFNPSPPNTVDPFAGMRSRGKGGIAALEHRRWSAPTYTSAGWWILLKKKIAHMSIEAIGGIDIARKFRKSYLIRQIGSLKMIVGLHSSNVYCSMPAIICIAKQNNHPDRRVPEISVGTASAVPGLKIFWICSEILSHSHAGEFKQTSLWMTWKSLWMIKASTFDLETGFWSK